MAAIPHLASWVRDYAAQGLYVIGNHCQAGTDQEVQAVCRQNRVNYTIVKSGRVEGDNSRGIPHMFIFDRTGKCVFEGHPGSAANALKDAMAAAPHPLLADLPLKKLAKLGQALKSGQPVGAVLKQAKGKMSASDAETAAEAKGIVERCTAYADKLVKDADGLAESDPYECYALLERIKKEFSGAEQSAAAEKKLAAHKKDKSFMAQYEAGKILADIMKTGAELKGIGSKPVDLSDKTCLKANRSAATKIVAGIATLKKKHADTKYCAEALEYAKTIGLEV
jgi:hypothetical protein